MTTTESTETKTEKRKGNGQAFSSEKRGQTFFLHAWEVTMVGGKGPRDIPAAGHPLADPDVDLPVDMALVASLRMRGQRQAIEVRKEKVPDGLKLRAPESMADDELAVIVFGRERTKAIRYINDTDGTWGTPDEMLIECKPTARGTTQQDAAEDSMIENGARKTVRALSVIAKAKAYIATYAENPDDPDQETLYRCAVANGMTIDRLKELLDFSEKADAKTMRAIKDGTLGIQAAVNLIKLPPEKRAEVIAQAKQNGTPVSSTTVRNAVRQEKGKAAVPTKAEIRDLLAKLASPSVVDTDRTATARREAVAEVLAWILGKGPEPAYFLTPPESAARLKNQAEGGKVSRGVKAAQTKRANAARAEA